LPFGATYALNTSLLWNDYVCQPEPALNDKTWNTRVAQVLGGGSGMFLKGPVVVTGY
jgi:hypothetical protein